MSSHSEDSAKISRDAFTWLLGAGAFAVLLSVSLAVVDYRLSHSLKEKQLGATLKELRTAQSEMDSRVTDHRQTQDFIIEPVVAASGAEAAESEHGSGHH